jgi:hypothetical protein
MVTEATEDDKGDRSCRRKREGRVPEVANTENGCKDRQDGGTRWCELGVWLL